MLKKLFLAAAALLTGSSAAAMAASPAQNLKAAETFLAANARKPKVMTTASGLQYMVLKPGAGAKPGPTSGVSVTYKGYFVSGKVFDQSRTPISFGVNQVVPGWTEALQLMPVGAKYRLWLHPRLGYGTRQSGPIAPNSLLVFDVELLSINP